MEFSRKRNMPPKNKILEYWHIEKIFTKASEEKSTRLEGLGKNQPQKTLFGLYNINPDVNSLNIIEKTDFCFACGLQKITQRAHILAVSEGGNDTVENLHLLCKSCHDESDMLSGQAYWNWFNDKDENLAMQYWFKDKLPSVKRIQNLMLTKKAENEWSMDEIADFIKKS